MRAVEYIRPSHVVSRDHSILPGVALMALAVVLALFGVFSATGAFETLPNLFLLPWLFGLAVVMLTPSAILYYQGKFSFANPLVFATFSYLFPAFVVGGFFFAVGWSQPYFATLIQDASYSLPMTVVLVGLGYIGLSAGYFVPPGAKLGALIGRKLPVADYPISSFVFPGIALLLIGLGILATVFSLGRFGYQLVERTNSYDGIVYLTTMFWTQGCFILWLILFKQEKWHVVFIPLTAALVAIGFGIFLFAGNRSSLISFFFLVILAYVLSGRRFKAKESVLAGMVLSVVLVIGMVYGSTFRDVKGTEEQQDVGQYVDNVVKTVDKIESRDISQSVSFGFENLTGRIDILSTLAVVVSNYEQLAPYEEAYGLSDNIWVDSTTFFVPRVLWEDKPVASDPRKFSDLYFNFSGSSYAITPIGDLLRNYGIVGVPLGMFLLGFLLRVIYRALVEDQKPTVWRITLYFMLLTAISWEGFYATIIPTVFKVGFTAIIGVLFVCLIARQIVSRAVRVA